MRGLRDVLLPTLLLPFLAAPAFTADPVFLVPSGPAAPPPAPPPAARLRLESDALLVIPARGDGTVRAVPASAVRVTKVAGPLTVRAKFADGPGPEIRVFKEPFVFLVEPVERRDDVTLLMIPFGLKADAEIQTVSVDVTGPQAPLPPPKPVPPDPPPKPPTPKDSPFPGVSGLHVLVVYQDRKLATLPPAQQSVLFAASVRNYLNAKCPVGPDGRTRQWRMWDAEVDASGADKLWRDAFARPRGGEFWILLSNGRESYEGPLPENVDKMLELLKKYGE